MNPEGRNHPCRTKEQARDESGRKKSSLRKKRARQGCIREEEIIPVEEKSKLGMNPGRRNNPCYEVTIVKKRLQEISISRQATFVFL